MRFEIIVVIHIIVNSGLVGHDVLTPVKPRALMGLIKAEVICHFSQISNHDVLNHDETH